MDKWLWAARFFKTRALAAKACDLGRVRLGQALAKAGRDVKVGDRLFVTNEGGDHVLDVLGLSAARGPALMAQALYRETEESLAARAKLTKERKLAAQFDPVPASRPDKRDRRALARVRGRA